MSAAVGGMMGGFVVFVGLRMVVLHHDEGGIMGCTVVETITLLCNIGIICVLYLSQRVGGVTLFLALPG